MMLKTGNRRGFTFIEVMVATCVLALGVTLLYQAFFLNLDSFSYCLNSLELIPWMDEKVWDAGDSIRRFGSSAQIETEGDIVKRNKHFKWNMAAAQIDEAYDKAALYNIELFINWKEGSRKVELSRNLYVSVPPPIE